MKKQVQVPWGFRNQLVDFLSNNVVTPLAVVYNKELLQVATNNPNNPLAAIFPASSAETILRVSISRLGARDAIH